MKNKIIILLVLLLSGTIKAWPQEQLDKYLEIAAENNPELKARFSEYMASLETVTQAGSLPDPRLAFAYFISPVETRLGPQQFKVSASQAFPWFGTLAAAENLEAGKARLSYEAMLESRSSLFRDVRSLYYNIYFNRKASTIVRENLEILESFQKLVMIRIQSGSGSSVDELRIEMEKGDLENQLALLLDKQQSFETEFSKLLNSESRIDVDTPDELWAGGMELDREQILDSILLGNHSLRTETYKTEVLSSRLELTEKMSKPGFSLGIDYTLIGKGENNFTGNDALMFPVVGISIPLYRKKYRAMADEVVYLQEANSYRISDRENILESIFSKAWTEYMDADRRIKLFEKQKELAIQSLELMETGFSAGTTPFEEFLRMERKLLTYSLEYERAMADKQASLAFIWYLMGR